MVIFALKRIYYWLRLLALLFLVCRIGAEAFSNHLISYNRQQEFTEPDTSKTETQPFAGKLSRRAKAAQLRQAVQLPTAAKIDTSRSTLDIIRSLPRDSSARLAQFQYIRKDKPNVDVIYQNPHPLFLTAPAIIKHQAELDSNTWTYRVSMRMQDFDTRIPIDVPFEVYTSLRLKQSIRQNWEALAQPYLLEEEKKTTLGDLMGKVTNIEIPIPKNPLFSIFGKNIIRMNINGSIDIRGGFKHTESDVYTFDPAARSQTSPDFQQEIMVGVKGEIGDKLKIDADWNTQRTFEYENQLHVRYQGYEDEIVQSVEAGNVSLPTKSSFFSGGQALFGIKANFQLGPLRLTTVATQKKGQIKEMTVSGGRDSRTFNKRLTEYSKNHFFVDTLYERFYEALFRPGRIINKDMQDNRIIDIEVWETSRSQIPVFGERFVVAFFSADTIKKIQNDLAARAKDYQLDKNIGYYDRCVKLKEGEDFTYNDYAGIISLNKYVPDDHIIAVSYITAKGDTIGNSSQTIRESDTLKLVMKLVKPKNLDPSLKTGWRLMLRNRYPLNVYGIDKSSFDVHLEYQLPGQPPVEEVLDQNIGLLHLFGLDRYTGTEKEGPDKVFDYFENITIDERRGEIIFPLLKPFHPDYIKKFLIDNNIISDNAEAQRIADSLGFKAIYDTLENGAANDYHNRYYLRGTVQGSASNVVNIGFNVVEGSVEVISGGQRLTPNADYTVDYISGVVKITNQSFLQPGRDIQVKYEANDLFQLASKSLIGARGEFDLGKNSSLGFTLMNYSQQSLSDKVRIGEEPISNTIIGFDAGTTINAPWLTDALNNIPGIKTTAGSQISLRGEAAYMLPNPNTRRSPVAGDGDKGAAYIDDFEGARQIIPLGESFATWKEASAPWFVSTIDRPEAIGSDGRSISTSKDMILSGYILSDVDKMEYKGKAAWFNLYPTDVYISSIWKEKSYVRGEDQVIALNFYFKPGERGAFNYSPNLENTIGLGKPYGDLSHMKSWAGMQKSLGMTSGNLVDQNIAFIELWINIVNPDDSAKINIDLGSISEDVIPNKKLNTEDGLGSLGIRTGVLDPKYDWGLDTIPNSVEVERFKDFIDSYKVKGYDFSNDPSGDDWKKPPDNVGIKILDVSTAEQYVGINGTEGNGQQSSGTDYGMFPDGEDLNGNGEPPDMLNNYFEYEIPLDTSSTDFKKLIAGEGANRWYQIRIPLADYKRRIGEPTFTNIEDVRVWVTGATKPVLFRIVNFNLVGNQWEKRDKSDSTYEISVVNIEDNPRYRSPRGVTREKDRTRPDQNILGNEQSLNLIVRNLTKGNYKEVVKNYKMRPIDMFNYRTLKMFVHGETGDDIIKGYRRFEYHDAKNYDAEFFMRFGDDTSNYYEYRAPLRPGWSGNDVVIKFADLTALKALRGSSTTSPRVPVEGGAEGATYFVRGNPRLDRIQFISIGLENPDSINPVTPENMVLTGELWVNELRLTDVDDTPGWAYKFDASIKFADFAGLGFSMTEQDPFFHGIEDRFGTRNTRRSWNLSTSFALHTFLPESWSGSMLSFSYSHSESMNKPRYLPGQDILVEEAAALIESQMRARSIDGSREYSPGMPQGYGVQPSQSIYKDANDVRLKSEDLNISDSYALPTIKLILPIKSWIIKETINKMTFSYNYTESKSRNPSIEYSKSWSWNTTFRYATDFSQENYLSLLGAKIFYTPRNLGFGASLSRNQNQTKARTLTAVPSMNHNMSAQRSMEFGWKFYEGKLFGFGLNYNVNVGSSLWHLNVDKNNNFRSFSSVLKDIFFTDRLINFGRDQNYAQNMAFDIKLATPKILSLDKVFTPNVRYSVGYRWSHNLQAGEIGRAAGWSNSPGFSLDITLKPISDLIWSPVTSSKSADTTKQKGLKKVSEQIDLISRILIKYPFFDYEKISISFSQQNAVSHNMIFGKTGFSNLFGRVPFFQNSLPEYGPSLLYQLGLASDPNGYVILKTKKSFPFITGYTVRGIRTPARGGLSSVTTDSYNQNNNLSFQTQRKLWEGANLQMSWSTSWSYNRQINGYTDSLGHVSISSMSISGSISRSYISLPPVFIFKFFKTGLEKVSEKYEEYKASDPDNSQTNQAIKLSRAFEEGMEAFPWLNKLLGSFVPRMNWNFQWSGLEKFSIFNSFAKSVNIRHSYNSTYTESWRINQQGKEEISNQKVTYRFSPLIEVGIAFKQFLKGDLNATVSYSMSSNYDLSPTGQNAMEGSNSSFSITLSYGRKGFELPIFGLSLSNNIDFSFSYNSSTDKSISYEFRNFTKDGIPRGGSTRTTMEPNINYTLSDRVSARLFYRYTKYTPDVKAATSYGYTMTEGGVNIKISIR